MKSLWPALPLVLGCALACAGAAAPGGAAWPMFRGEPTLRGVAAGALPDDLVLRWSFTTTGPTRSSAAIVGGRVYFGSGDGFVYALDLASGKERWKFKTEDLIEATPLVIDGTVYIGSSDTFFYALEAETGALCWKVQTGDKILGGANWLRGSDGALRIVVGSYDGKLYCLEPATGKVLWTYETSNYINGAPAVAQGRVIFGGCDAILHAVDADGRKQAETEAGAYIAGSVAAFGDCAYFGHYGDEVLSIDFVAGKVLWKFKERDFPYFSSPAVTEKFVVIGGRDKRLHCLERDTGKKVWEFATRAKVDSSPVIVGDRIVVGSDDGRLYVVALATGRELWSYEIGKGLTASPAVADGMVVIGSEDGAVYAFGRKT